MSVFSALDILLAVKKMEGPVTTLTFLEITLDTQSMQASLPTDKLVRIRDHIHAFTISQVCTRVELQSLLGMLNFAIRIIPQGGEVFHFWIIGFVTLSSDSDSRVKLDPSALSDLHMWDKFLQHWNGVTMFIPAESGFSPQVSTDAAATKGYAAIFDTHWLAGPWPNGVLAIPGFTETSVLFEIYPIVLAAQVWGHLWAGKTMFFSMDNQATSDIVNKGRSCLL